MRIFYLIFVILSSCEENTKVTNKDNKVGIEKGMFSTVSNLFEFEYKGHTYISCEVYGGISLTHAGHCHCNKQ